MHAELEEFALTRTNLKIVFVLVNLALWGLIIYAGVSIGMDIWSGGKTDPELAPAGDSQPTAVRTPIEGRKPVQTYNRIVAQDIFGTTRKTVQPKAVQPVQPIELKETPLNLKLKGTVVGDNVASYAMIFDGRTRKEEIYRVQEYVQGAKIVEIRKDSVILQGSKGKELLSLSSTDSTPDAPQIPAKVPPRPLRRRVPPKIEKNEAETEAEAETGAEPSQTD